MKQLLPHLSPTRTCPNIASAAACDSDALLIRTVRTKNFFCCLFAQYFESLFVSLCFHVMGPIQIDLPLICFVRENELFVRGANRSFVTPGTTCGRYNSIFKKRKENVCET